MKITTFECKYTNKLNFLIRILLFSILDKNRRRERKFGQYVPTNLIRSKRIIGNAE